MPSRQLFISHRFGGGWATDFGPEATGLVPDQSGIVQLPWLVDAEDCLFEFDGGLRMAPGTTKLNSSQLESGATVMGIFDWWRQGTSGSPAQKRVAFVNDRIYVDDGSGNFSSVKTGLVAGAVPNFCTLDDFAILSNDASANVPMSYDGTTFQNLAGTPPNFSFAVKHKNTVFAAGVDSLPSRLYYCVPLNPEDWTNAGSGSIDIDPGDGDRITGLFSHRNELFVFKGPYKGSIHRITGSSSSDFARTTFIEGLGAVGQNSIFRYGDDVGFLWSDGSIRSLAATDQFGNYAEAALSRPISEWMRDNINFTQIKKAWAITDHNKGVCYISLPTFGSSTNNTILALDYRFSPARWTKIGINAASMCMTVDAGASNKQIPLLGGYDGYVRKWGQPTRSNDGTAFSYKVTTPFIDYGSPHITKTLAKASVGLSPHNNGDITFAWTRDNETEQTTTINQNGGAVLGTASANQFTLNNATTGKLGGARFLNRWYEAEEGGEFRSIQYRVSDSTNNEDLELHNIGAFIEAGAEDTTN